MKCFYHSADLDGHCSGAIVKYVYGDDMEMIPFDYGDPFPWDTIEKGELIYMIDLSLQPFEEMLKLNEMCNLIWIDHHITAIREQQKSGEHIKGMRTIAYAACELTWLYFKQEPIPVSVKLLGRYDIWDHSDERVLPFQYGMRSLRTDPNEMLEWDEIFENPEAYLSILNKGKILLDYQMEQYAKMMKNSFEMRFNGHNVIAINAGGLNSLAFDTVYNPEKHDYMMAFVFKGDKWTISMYTTHDHINVGEIAKSLGGGGHRQAAGFKSEFLPFDLSPLPQ